MQLIPRITSMERVIYSLAAEVMKTSGELAHATFMRRRERWLSDMLRDEDEVSRFQGAVIVFAPAAGEVASVVPLLGMLVRKRPDVPILVCVATTSGISAARVAGLPSVRLRVDSRRLYERAIRALSPRGMVLVQVAHVAGMPINLVCALAANDLPVVVVNGYLPDIDVRKSSRWMYRGFRGTYRDIDAYCVQTEEDRSRLIALGADAQQIVVAGNMKFDAALFALGEDSSETLAGELRLSPDDPLIVAGSTHPGEEQIILDAFRKVRSRVGSARLIIAPRVIRRSEEVAQLALQQGFSVGLRSRMSGRPDVIILDTVGELKLIYSAAWVAFIGGTLVPVGGHNVLEPAVRGRPVVFGPHVRHTSGAAELLVKDGGAFRVENGEELARVLTNLLDNADLRRTMGERGLASVRSRAGATQCCAGIIQELLLLDSGKHCRKFERVVST